MSCSYLAHFLRTILIHTFFAARMGGGIFFFSKEKFVTLYLTAKFLFTILLQFFASWKEIGHEIIILFSLSDCILEIAIPQFPRNAGRKRRVGNCPSRFWQNRRRRQETSAACAPHYVLLAHPDLGSYLLEYLRVKGTLEQMWMDKFISTYIKSRLYLI